VSVGEKHKTGISKSTNSDSDTDIAPVGVPTKKYRLEDGKSVKGNKSNDSGDQRPMVTASLPTESDRDFEPEVYHHDSTQSSGHEVIQASADADTQAKTIRGPKRVAVTQLKEAPRARVSFASARTIPNLKPFVPLDSASIRRGFQKGGASSKKEYLKKGAYYVVFIFGLDSSVDTTHLQLLSQRRFGSFHFLKLPSRNL
jgi:hypothetical protein